jgi:HK97 family phage prohead protease
MSEDLGGFREVIAPGAFDGCMSDDVRCLINHDDNLVLGRTKSKTLTLAADGKGLQFDCDPADTSFSRDLAVSMERGDIDQCSFSFTVAPGGAEWGEDANNVPVRTVRKIARLYDVSVVTYPAYTATSAELRTNAEILKERESDQSRDVASLDTLRREIEIGGIL